MDATQNPAVSTYLEDHVINIAGTMQYEFIAEGIEHECQMAYFKEGVKFGWSLFFAKAMPESEFIEFVLEMDSKVNLVNNILLFLFWSAFKNAKKLVFMTL